MHREGSGRKTPGRRFPGVEGSRCIHGIVKKIASLCARGITPRAYTLQQPVFSQCTLPNGNSAATHYKMGTYPVFDDVLQYSDEILRAALARSVTAAFSHRGVQRESTKEAVCAVNAAKVCKA